MKGVVSVEKRVRKIQSKKDSQAKVYEERGLK
jgi:hypothetical protein